MAKSKQDRRPLPPVEASPSTPSPVESLCFLILQFCLAALIVYWFVVPPATGVAVTVLALAAGAMSVNEGMGRWKKGAWLLLLVFLAQIELRAIKKDRGEQDDKFVQTLGTITGGDSYAVVSLRPLGVGGPTYPFLFQSGVNPLHGVKIKVVRLFVDQQGSMQTVLLDPPREIAVGERNQLTEYLFPTPKRSIDYVIYCDALNGHWAEKDCLRLVDGKWYEAIQVSRSNDYTGAGGSKLLLTQIDPGYPTINGKPDWQGPIFDQ